MKKFIVLFMMVLAMMSCADSKTFERADGTKFVAEPYGWASYVIFDDDQDMLYSQKDNFIHIDYMHGITKEHIEQAIKILNK